MGSAPSPPPAPTVGSQLLNQSTAFGSTAYTKGPNGQETATSTPSGPLGQSINANLQSFAGQGAYDPSQFINQAMGMQEKYLQPYFTDQQQQMQAQLQNQGFSQSDQAYQNAERQMQQNQGGVMAANLDKFLPEAQQNYMMPLNAALTAGNPANTQIPGAQGALSNAVNTTTQAQQYDYGQQNANYAAMMGGLFGIPSSLLGGWAKGGFGMPSFGGGGQLGVGPMGEPQYS